MINPDDLDPKNVVVIYHGPCNDGFTAAWAAWLKFGDDAQYFQTMHSKKPIKNLKNKDVFILDFCYPRHILENIAKEANSLLVLDHHITAQKETEGLDCVLFDLNRSGAGISWDYFHGTERPKIVQHTEDYDLWKFRTKYTKQIISVMETTEKTFQNWSNLFLDMESAEKYQKIIEKGNHILEYKNYLIEERFIKNPTYIYLDHNIVPAANSDIWQSDIGAKLSKNNSMFSVIWSQSADGKYRYSLRSDSKIGVDVSEIAKRYGGGGHKNAAGFVSSDPPVVVDWADIDIQEI